MKVDLDPKIFEGHQSREGFRTAIDGEKIPYLEIWEKGKPFILEAKPFIGEFKIQFSGPSETGRAICYSLAQPFSSSVIPRYTDDLSQVPKNTFCLIATGDDGDYRLLLALSNRDMLSGFEGAEGRLIFRAESGSSREANQNRVCLIGLTGRDPHQLMKRGWELALEGTGAVGRLKEAKGELPEWMSTLGFVIGSGNGKEITHEGVIARVKELIAIGFIPGYVIIEEGWQQGARSGLDRSGRESLINFQADTRKFPRGLKGVVDDLHRIGVRHIGVWHGIMGHRGGIHPKLAKQYDLPPDDQGRYFLGYDLGRTYQFYHDYYGFLRSQGIDFVKVGDQSNLSSFSRQGMDITRLSSNLQEAIQSAASIQFHSPVLNSECLRPENLLYWASSKIAGGSFEGGFDGPMEVTRLIRDGMAHAFWLSPMMQIDLPSWRNFPYFRETLAIFYSLSESMWNLTEIPDEESRALLKRAFLPSGKLIQSDAPFLLSGESLFIDPCTRNSIYQGHTHRGKTEVIGLFHLSEEGSTYQGKLQLSSIEGITADKAAVYSYQHGFLGVFNRLEEIPIQLEPFQAEILTFMPVENGIAVIGSPFYYLMSGPIRHVNRDAGGLHIQAWGSAPIAIYCEPSVLEVTRNNEVVPWDYSFETKLLIIDPYCLPESDRTFYTVSFEN
jgi:raffinose synthase